MAAFSEMTMLVWLLSALASAAGHLALFVLRLAKRGCRGGDFRTGPCGGQEQPDRLDGIATSEVQKRLRQRVEAVADSTGACYMCYHAGVAFIFLTHHPTWFTELQKHCMTVISFTFLLVRLCPPRWLDRLLPWCYIWVMSCLACLVLTVDKSDLAKPLRCMQQTGLARLVYSVTFGQAGPCLAANALFTLINVGVFQTFDESVRYESVFSFAVMEALASTLIVALTLHARRSLERETSHMLKSRSLSVESSAMTALLELVCDAVVELDASLHVAEPASKLAAMLGISRNIKGMELTQHIPNDVDRERFQRGLSGIAGDTGGIAMPGALTLTLCDSMNNKFPVEIFYVVFAKPSSALNYFVGIRELADQPVARLPPSRLTDRAEAALVRLRDGPRARSAHGTAPVAERHAVGGGLAPASSASPESCQGSESSQWTRVDARFQVTSMRAKRLTIMDALMQWNSAIPKLSCCAFHAAVRDLCAEARALLSLPCPSDFDLIGNHQCEACGLVLCLDEHEADFEHCVGSRAIRVRQRRRRGRRHHTEPKPPDDAARQSPAEAAESKPSVPPLHFESFASL